MPCPGVWGFERMYLSLYFGGSPTTQHSSGPLTLTNWTVVVCMGERGRAGEQEPASAPPLLLLRLWLAGGIGNTEELHAHRTLPSTCFRAHTHTLASSILLASASSALVASIHRRRRHKFVFFRDQRKLTSPYRVFLAVMFPAQSSRREARSAEFPAWRAAPPCRTEHSLGNEAPPGTRHCGGRQPASSAHTPLTAPRAHTRTTSFGLASLLQYCGPEHHLLQARGGGVGEGIDLLGVRGAGRGAACFLALCGSRRFDY